MRPLRSALATGLVALASLPALSALGGCKATPGYQGSDGQVLATYKVRKLEATLPPEVRVPSAVAAARAALMQRGYTVRSTDATEEEGDVSAVPADAGFFESIEVKVRQTGGGTNIRIIAEPIGNQAKSRAILDSILAKLGR